MTSFFVPLILFKMPHIKVWID